MRAEGLSQLKWTVVPEAKHWTVPQPRGSNAGAFLRLVMATSRWRAGLRFPSTFGSRTQTH